MCYENILFFRGNYFTNYFRKEFVLSTIEAKKCFSYYFRIENITCPKHGSMKRNMEFCSHCFPFSHWFFQSSLEDYCVSGGKKTRCRKVSYSATLELKS